MRRVPSICSKFVFFWKIPVPNISNYRAYADQSHPSSFKRPGLLSQYKNLVEEGKLQHDTYQEGVALKLENLVGRLHQYEKEMEDYQVLLSSWENTREDQRRKLLMDEAKNRQEDKTINNQYNRRFGRWFSRFVRKRVNVEPGVGKRVSYLNREKKLDSLVGQRPIPPPAPIGLYIYGSVGSGKTLLMDMFYRTTEGIVKHRKRFHFHEAMLEIHQHMHKEWKTQVTENSSPSNISSWILNLPFDSKIRNWLLEEEKFKQEVQMKNILLSVADKFLIDRQLNQSGACILCFDEIQTVDVFAVVALSGILSRLLSTGTVLVATSNRDPKDLNQDGMQNDIFQKLVEGLEQCCEKVLVGSEIDYRRLLAKKCMDQVHFFFPLNRIAVTEYERMWHQVTSHSTGRIVTETISVMFGRELEIPESCSGVARLTFDYICGRPVGAADYIALAKNYHTVFISGIPVMSMRIRDKARRFITLVDELYNHHCRLFCLADSGIDDLFQGTEEGRLFDLESFQFETETEGAMLRRNVLAEGNVSSGGTPASIVSMLSGQEETFAFRRAVSRLIEMQTPLYLDGVVHLHPCFQGHQDS